MNNKTILFLDNTYPEPYQLETLTEKPLGGTEASIIRTALILSRIHCVFVAQKYRNVSHRENSNLQFIPKSDLRTLKPDCIIVLRKFNELKKMHLIFPKAQLFLWLHTYKNYEYVLKRFGFSRTKTQVICNSNTHKKNTNHLLNSTLVAHLFSIFTKKINVHYCYNPIEKPKIIKSKRNINKLLFYSSPNKGLDQVIAKFKKIRKKIPSLCLYIANPGYKLNDAEKADENIIYLGSLAHEEMMQHVRESLCVFYPQETFAETFGLIYAEASTHGTVIIADDIGSAREIMDKNNQPIDVSNIELIINTIKKLQKHYPKVSYNEKFSKSYILNQWQRLLG